MTENACSWCAKGSKRIEGDDSAHLAYGFMRMNCLNTEAGRAAEKRSMDLLEEAKRQSDAHVDEAVLAALRRKKQLAEDILKPSPTFKAITEGSMKKKRKKHVEVLPEQRSLYVVMAFREWKGAFQASNISWPVEFDTSNGCVGFLQVFATEEQAKAEYPNHQVMRIVATIPKEPQ